MREFVRIVEMAQRVSAHDAPMIVRVFHGSPEGTLRLLPGPLYGVRDFGFAATYAIHRHTSPVQPHVYTVDFRFSKVAGDEEIAAICEELGLPQAGIADIATNSRLLDRFKQDGYDGAHAWDFGFRADFEELPVWMVFDAQRQATIIDDRSVTAADIGLDHTP